MSGRETLRRVLARIGLTGGSENRASEHIGIVVNPGGDLPILQLSGELDHHAAERVREVVQRLLDEPEAEGAAAANEAPSVHEPSLLLDLDNLTYIDSGGLALFFDIARAFEEAGQGGYLGILNPNPHVRRLLEISGLGGVRQVRILTEASEVPGDMNVPPARGDAGV